MKEEHKQDLTTADVASATQREAAKPPEAQQTPPAPGQPQPAGATAQERQPEAHPTPLFSPDEAQKLRSGWDNIQTNFVDDPRRAVQEADHLVAEVIKRLADSFAQERAQLEQQWSRGGNVSTEDLRLALRRYRSFFDRLLSI